MFTPEGQRVNGQCSFARCRQDGTLVFHYNNDRLEACERHEAKAGDLMLKESRRKNPVPRKLRTNPNRDTP